MTDQASPETQGGQTPQPQDPQQQYVVRAQEQVAHLSERIGELAEANRALIAAEATEDTFTGQATFATAFIYGTCACDVTTHDGTRLHFYGTQWGLGLGGGTSWGGGTFGYLTPDQIVGDCSYEIHSVAGVGGYVQVTWWRGSQLLGTFIGGALAVSVSVGGGSGKWSYA